MEITYIIQKSRRRSMSIQVADDRKIIVKVPLGTPTFVAENFIRLQKSRWGSCSVDRNLNFNCLLVLMPPEILDSVVVHELCHRRHMNHSKEFYDEVLRIFPDYKRCNKWLKQNGGVFFKRCRHL